MIQKMIKNMKKQRTIELSFEAWGVHILDMWLSLKNSRKSLEEYFQDNYINSIAIYGLGVLGKHLYEELRSRKHLIRYGIDRNADRIRIDGLQIKTLKDELPEVDAVVVTPIDYYSIEKDIRHKMGENIEIISIEDVVDYCYGKLD